MNIPKAFESNYKKNLAFIQLFFWFSIKKENEQKKKTQKLKIKHQIICFLCLIYVVNFPETCNLINFPLSSHVTSPLIFPLLFSIVPRFPISLEYPKGQL